MENPPRSTGVITGQELKVTDTGCPKSSSFKTVLTWHSSAAQVVHRAEPGGVFRQVFFGGGEVLLRHLY